jgi:hypothetical protein
VKVDQRNEGGGGEQFVGDRVKQYSQRRHLRAFARQIAIQEVGGRGEQKNPHRPEVHVVTRG